MLDLLESFAAVVELTSLNQAAKRLNISQPALSRQVAKLEEELGVELFIRNGKRLELTRVGQLTYEFALDIRNRQLDFLKSIAAFKAEGQATITIGASLTTLQTTLPLFISSFVERHPDARLKAVTGKTHEIISLVREQTIDLGIVADAIREPGLMCIPLFADHLQLVLPRRHPLASIRNWSMDRLDGLPMLLFSKGTWYRKLIDNLFRRYRIMPDIRMEIDSFEAIVRLLSTCHAAALLPHSYLRLEWLKDNDLIAVPLKELKQTERVTSIVYGEQALLSPIATQFIDEMMEAAALSRLGK
ncbi:LysR family transcriptional regulator [Paenibacillus alvei]|uniref:LysR family transcriptional regulator n=1 Tax=Paenibacillus alvei TaxID=44250 RepID=A0AAP7DJY7_PAEAL|nr:MULTISPECIES: LysR family transcriptional regulator [Paenibacillus]EJW14925.1 putative HTH-type transcriptional regulator YybE [Paenibacillus alvei DSM 29]MBG9734641.1 LysR family transcriptional regulator [Paenibacillus alvei]MBG9743048.1 LysR family transcriptional regulator [Paenibacillus alvei]MCY7483529.1 LysR family transcriptional regulator [Paenibacillus alvei]MCY9540972.1 LysR family transcriptional regulator [Paenibacillus alvei]